MNPLMSRPVLDWLKRDPRAVEQIELAGRSLPIVIRHLSQARRLTLRLSPDGSEVRVSMPRWGRTAEALAFVRARAGWLERQIAALPKTASLSGGGVLVYRGKALIIDHAAGGSRRVRIMDDAIALGGPAETLAPRLRRWLTAEARRLLADDLAGLLLRGSRPATAQTGPFQCPAPLGQLLCQGGSPDQLATGHGTG
jgi:predicted metal-dependent hydrolase